MKLTIPLYIHEIRSEGQFYVQPLFHSQHSVSHTQLHKALEQLNLELRTELRKLAKQARHEALAELLPAPELKPQKLRLQLELRRRSLPLRLLMVSFALQGRRIAFAPAIPELWFTLARGETLSERAQEVYTAWFRQLEQSAPDALSGSLWGLAERDKAWLSEIHIDLTLAQALPAAEEQSKLIALFSAGPKPSGEAELEQVGRCLNWLYPDGLDLSVGRESEAALLEGWMQHADRRPVVVIGPPGVGKTALIHAGVRAMTSRRRNQWDSRQNVWQLAPQRLIAGMSFVGQWEERLLAILETAQEKDLSLYFDDLPGLFEAGKSANSSLHMAQILRGWIESRKVRLLAEATPAEWQLVREMDRGFADQFSVIQLKEPALAESLPMLLSLIRRYEAAQGCSFGPESLNLMLQLLGRFVRDTVLPGKAARLLQQLAVRHRRKRITRAMVLEAFQHATGLNTRLLETDEPLSRAEIRSALQTRVIGQARAIEALTDRITLARARLNDPERPLASLLFLGPTGVGKTECAKALAAWYFGSEERLLRFDMNEYGTPAAVQRLIGNWREPDGLLTSEIRRQPFAVLLFDEIEKADPSAYDLLLQVLGEGRLTDARGRTADFTQALIILTSNLGVRESGRQPGFTEAAADAGRSYLKAAEAFFRPEFFNRLDLILPFSSLSRAEIARIASLLIGKLFAREGLVRRRTMLRIDPAAMEQVIELGYHPQLGARALKRALERQLAQPVGMALARLRPDTPTLITLLPGRPDLRVDVQALHQVEPRQVPSIWREGLTPRQVWEKLDAWCAAFKPAEASSGSRVDFGGEAAYHRLMLREFHQELRSELADLGHRFRERQTIAAAQISFRARPYRWGRYRGEGLAELWASLFSSHDLHDTLLRQLNKHQDETPAIRLRLESLLHRCSLLAGMAACPPEGAGRWLVLLQALDEHSVTGLAQQARLLKHSLQEVHGLDCSQLEELHTVDRRCLLVEGLHAPLLLALEAGLHLHVGADNRMMPIQLSYHPVSADNLAELAAAGARAPQSAEVIRLYHGHGTVLDWRSGTIWDRLPDPDDLFQTWLRLLERPVDLLQSLNNH